MDEVANVYTKQRSARHDKLKKLKTQYGEMLRERRDNLRKLSVYVGSHESFTSQEKKVLPRLYHDLRTQRVKLLLERAEAETLLARRKKAEGAATEPVRKEIAQIEDRLAVLNCAPVGSCRGAEPSEARDAGSRQSRPRSRSHEGRGYSDRELIDGEPISDDSF